MAWQSVLDLLFPPQCAGCNALGCGLCHGCAPASEPFSIELPMLRVTALAPYAGTVRSAVLALKDGRRDVAEALGAAMASLIAKDSLLVPVPTTRKRKRVRGIDGVTLVAQHAARIASARVMCALVQYAGDAQRGRTRAQRLAAQGRFSCDMGAVAGRRVLLIDDVCTTGTTLQDCAASVREAGGVVTEAVVVAVALPEAGGFAPATKSVSPWNPVPTG